MVEKVVVAVDGGAASEAALEWVITRSRGVELSLDIVTVDELGEDPAGDDSEHRLAHDIVLRSARSRVADGAPRVPVSTAVRVGDPTRAIIEASLGADLLVIGTNRTSTIAGVLHGTLPLRVAGHARCTTVVVPYDWAPVNGPVVIGWVDDPTADRALDLAAAEADRTRSVLRIVHVWKPPVATGVPGVGTVAVDELIDVHRELLAQAASRVRAEYPGLTVTEHLESGSASTALAQEAKGASLIVVGTRGLGPLATVLLGSVSHQVLLDMPSAMAVVPPQKEPIEVYPEVLDEDLI